MALTGSAAHVRHPGTKPESGRGRKGDHRAKPCSSRHNASTSNAPRTLTRCPLRSASSASVSGAAASDNALDTISTGTNTASGSGASSARSRGSRRQVNTRLVFTSYRRATCETVMPGVRVCATIRCFSSSVHRRRIRCRPPHPIHPFVSTCRWWTPTLSSTLKPATRRSLRTRADSPHAYQVCSAIRATLRFPSHR